MSLHPPPTFASILLAEDDLVCRETFSAILQRAGHQVEVVNDGQAALDRLEESPGLFDIVITDHQMPRLNGLELAQRLGWQNLFENRIIVISGQITATDRFAYHELPIHSIIDKPIKPQVLLAAVESILCSLDPSRLNCPDSLGIG